MASPTSPVNDRGQSLDALFTSDDPVPLIKLGIGNVDVGYDSAAAWQGVASHLDQQAFSGDGDEGVVVVAGVDEDGLVRRISVDPDGNLGVAVSGSDPAFDPLDASGTVTATGVSEEILAAEPTRTYLFVQNVGDDDLWLNFDDDAVEGPGGIRLTPGASVEYVTRVPAQAVNILGVVDSPFTLKFA